MQRNSMLVVAMWLDTDWNLLFADGPATQVDGVLTEAEASRFVRTAESIGLKHQGSKGSAYGEVSCTATA